MSETNVPASIPAVDFGDPRTSAFGTFLESHAKLTNILEADLQGNFGLSLAEVEVLIELNREPGEPVRPGELATRCAMTSSGCTRLIQRLERQGLLQRSRSKHDRRGQDISLTGRGEAVLASLLPNHNLLLEEHFWNQFSGDELATLTSLLARVANDS